MAQDTKWTQKLWCTSHKVDNKLKMVNCYHKNIGKNIIKSTPAINQSTKHSLRKMITAQDCQQKKFLQLVNKSMGIG